MQLLNQRQETHYKCHSTLRMKIFSGEEIKSVEHEIYEWLSIHSMRVEQICQSQCERNGRLLLLVSVFFSPLND